MICRSLVTGKCRSSRLNLMSHSSISNMQPFTISISISSRTKRRCKFQRKKDKRIVNGKIISTTSSSFICHLPDLKIKDKEHSEDISFLHLITLTVIQFANQPSGSKIISPLRNARSSISYSIPTTPNPSLNNLSLTTSHQPQSNTTTPPLPFFSLQLQYSLASAPPMTPTNVSSSFHPTPARFRAYAKRYFP